MFTQYCVRKISYLLRGRRRQTSCSRYPTHQRILRFIPPILPNPKFLLSSRPRLGDANTGQATCQPSFGFYSQPTGFFSQAPTGPYLTVPPCSVCGYTGHDRYTCSYLAFGFNAPRLPITVAQARPIPVIPATTVVQPRTLSIAPNTTVIPAHTVPVVPTRMVARKAVTLPIYKEGKCATTHIHRFVNVLALNGETDDLIKIALFGNSLTDANNYNWFITQSTTYPYQDFQELLTAFKLRYQEVDNDNQAYLKFRSLKQVAKESVDDYYERMMKLANQFATVPSDNFLMSNFEQDYSIIYR